jgi:galactose-6-phosphate isomerase
MPKQKTIALIYNENNDAIATEISEFIYQQGLEVINFHGSNVITSCNLAAKALLHKKNIVCIVAITTWGILPFMYLSKFKKLVVAEISDVYSAHMTKEHNNARVLSFSSKISNVDQIKNMVYTYLKANFEDAHHKIRLDMLDTLLRNK